MSLEDEVRRIVREELQRIFAASAGAFADAHSIRVPSKPKAAQLQGALFPSDNAVEPTPLTNGRAGKTKRAVQTANWKLVHPGDLKKGSKVRIKIGAGGKEAKVKDLDTETQMALLTRIDNNQELNRPFGKLYVAE